MRGLRRAWWVALLAAAFSPAGASGASRVRTVKLTPVIATGSLTYTWSGDPARGCAAMGVCGIHGELILRPQPSGQSLSPNGPMNVLLDPSGVARVIREDGGAVIGECIDLPSDSFGSILFSLPTHRANTASVQPAPSSGRCAGPTTADLAGVSVPVRRTGRFSVDLKGTRSFTAGPFSGTLVSTVRLAPASRSSGGGGFSGGFSSSSSGPGHPVTPPSREFVQLQYRVSVVPDTIQTHFSGASQPNCQSVDGCGASGSLAFTVAPSRGITVFGSRLVHRRLSRRQVLSDLRRGRLHLSAFATLTGHVSEVFNWPGGSSCSDAVAPSLLLSTGSPTAPSAAKRTIPVTVTSNGSGPGASVFRTHCPGPDDADLFGEPLNAGNETYARGEITAAQLLDRRSVLALTEPGTFSGVGYAGSRSGSIVLNLTLAKVTAGMQR